MAISSHIQDPRWSRAVLVPAALPRSFQEPNRDDGHIKRKERPGNEGYLEQARETQLAATLLYFLPPA